MAGYTPAGDAEKTRLLSAIGVSSFSELLKGIPEPLRATGAIHLPEGVSELEAVSELERLSASNAGVTVKSAFLGAGAYDHFIPAAVSALTSRSEFLTAYTPYQAEVSQGTLQAVYEYQSMICELTGMEVSNASLYDGATALAEAIIMAQSLGKKGDTCLIPASLNPFYRELLETYFRNLNIKLSAVSCQPDGTINLTELGSKLSESVFGVVIQSPNFFGVVENISEVAALKQIQPFQLIVIPNLVSLALLEAPGKQGADICVGEAHYLAAPPSFGGPLLGFMSTHKANIRQMPGRIVGKTTDLEGKRGFVLTAQTREQHIRREKATSNICSNEALVALGATITLSLLGRQGLVDMARLNVDKTQYAITKLSQVKGVSMVYGGPVFNEFTVQTTAPVETVIAKARTKGIIAGLNLEIFNPAFKNQMLIAVTEKKTKAEIDAFVGCFAV